MLLKTQDCMLLNIFLETFQKIQYSFCVHFSKIHNQVRILI